MSKVNIDFRKSWDKDFPDLPCWTDPKNEKAEFKPFKVMYESSGSEVPFLKWIKQNQYNNYELDFCLRDYKLCVEIDGGEHRRPEVANKDRRKSNMLQTLGWCVLRYPAIEILNSEQIVREQVLQCLLNNFEVSPKIRKKYEKFL